MARKKKYVKPKNINFIIEEDLWNKFIQDMEVDGYTEYTTYLTDIIKKVVGVI